MAKKLKISRKKALQIKHEIENVLKSQADLQDLLGYILDNLLSPEFIIDKIIVVNDLNMEIRENFNVLLRLMINLYLPNPKKRPN